MTKTDNLKQQRLAMAASSDVGTVRKENEDFYYYSQSKRFFAVCDGMGGHEKGDLASKYAGETMRDVIFANESVKKVIIENKYFNIAEVCQDLPSDVTMEAMKLVAGIRLANRRLFRLALQDKKKLGMGTTMVSAIFHEGHFVIAHVGDSRMYRLRQGELTRITTDHSWLNELLEDKEITEDEIQNFKKKNVLTRALGMAPTVKIDLQVVPVEADDLYLLCTDGLTNALPDELIHSILGAYHGSLQNKVSNLVSRAKMMDGSDNITAGLIHVAGQWHESTQHSKSYAVSDEPAQVSDYLDQSLKAIYPSEPVRTSSSPRKIGIASAVVTVVLILAFVILQSSSAERRTEIASTTALFKQSASPAKLKQASRTPRNSLAGGGRLVLLQLKDEKYLDMLNELKGVRVLDVVEEFSAGSPVSSGRYTWAVADNREKILYKRSDILLEPVNDWHEDSTGKSTGGAAANGQNISSQAPNNAMVYLLGDFGAAPFRGASVLVNGNRIGELRQYRESGFYLENGRYDIQIVDIQNNVLREKTNIEIKSGETIAIEF